MTKPRIWELDALRGLCVLGMLIVHLFYDITEVFGLIAWQFPAWLSSLAALGAGIFLLLSGLCATLGAHPLRRGTTVFACGMLCTIVTWGLSRLGLMESSMIIRFGMLHCLGLCMLLWPAVKRLPIWALALLGLVILAAGFSLEASSLRVASRWLFPLGLRYRGFSSGDYYPLLPCFGWFLLGSVAGRTLYKTRRSLLKADPRHPLPAALCFCGRHALVLYLIHQPLFFGILTLFTLKDGSL